MPEHSDLIGYAQAADTYWQAGWRGVLPLDRGAKIWPPSIKCPAARRKDPKHRADLCDKCVSYTGHRGIDPSYADIMAWSEQYPDGNLCLRMPLDTGEGYGVIGIDVDAYGAKTGAAALIEAKKRWGELPHAPISSSRDDQISGIRLFRVPAGTVLEDRIGFPELGIGDIEICQYHHRYVISWPSIHIEGRPYSWRDNDMAPIAIPTPGDLPWLPQAWIESLKVRPRVLDVNGAHFDVRQAMTAGAPTPLVAARLTQAIKELNLPGQSRHDTALGHVMQLLRFGKNGQSGVQQALNLLREVFVSVTIVDRSRTPESARDEFDRMINNDNAARELSAPGPLDWMGEIVVADAKPHPPESPNGIAPPPTVAEPPRPRSQLEEIERGFWDSRESLRMVYQTAMARMAPPWGTLAHCAARALSMIPPRVVLPPIIGGPGSLNWFVATVAKASAGKGASKSAADVLVPRTGFIHRKIGSGEGIIAAFGKTGDEDSAPEHECIMFTTNEIDTLRALNTRSSSTTLPILREGFFGEDLGFAYAAKDKRRLIPEHSYRMTLVIAAQPDRMDWLLADTGGGTPQRFMWFPAGDKRISRKKPWESGPLELPSATEWLYPRTLVIPIEAQELIEVECEKRAQDDGEAIDGHALFCREKFAYALTVLDGRTQMTSEDWELSGIASDVSTYTRDLARQAVAAAARIDALDRGEIRGIELAAADDSKQYEEAERIRHALRWCLSKIESAGGEGITNRALMQAADSKRVRRWVSAALQIGQSNGLIRALDGSAAWVKL